MSNEIVPKTPVEVEIPAEQYTISASASGPVLDMLPVARSLDARVNAKEMAHVLIRTKFQITGVSLVPPSNLDRTDANLNSLTHNPEREYWIKAPNTRDYIYTSVQALWGDMVYLCGYARFGSGVTELPMTTGPIPKDICHQASPRPTWLEVVSPNTQGPLKVKLCFYCAECKVRALTYIAKHPTIYERVDEDDDEGPRAVDYYDFSDLKRAQDWGDFLWVKNCVVAAVIRLSSVRAFLLEALGGQDATGAVSLNHKSLECPRLDVVGASAMDAATVHWMVFWTCSGLTASYIKPENAYTRFVSRMSAHIRPASSMDAKYLEVYSDNLTIAKALEDDDSSYPALSTDTRMWENIRSRVLTDYWKNLIWAYAEKGTSKGKYSEALRRAVQEALEGILPWVRIVMEMNAELRTAKVLPNDTRAVWDPLYKDLMSKIPASCLDGESMAKGISMTDIAPSVPIKNHTKLYNILAGFVLKSSEKSPSWKNFGLTPDVIDVYGPHYLLGYRLANFIGVRSTPEIESLDAMTGLGIDPESYKSESTWMLEHLAEMRRRNKRKRDE